MSEHDFISLNIQIGSGNRITISTADVAGMTKILNDLNYVDETDPEGISALDEILTHVETVNAAVLLKFPQVSGGAGPAGNTSAPVEAGKSCKHGPMVWREGTTKSGPNTGKPYKGWFCPAPRGTHDQCKPDFVNN